ncbi:YceI family protein [Fodinibius halophilus]|uniref:YceI family protein n=1 Tax=Fodinibius halophilus TaxID=1736908 RepID=A0A6M1TM45_9BACT|nr:YceI family protein [Fodinibius halophilus]NGP89510.1 YceI family protein [Fodinibius halophilus]
MSTATKKLWKIDPTHSEIQFKVKHLVISTVTGSFGSFEGSLEVDGEQLEGADIQFKADINSIDTNNEDRDEHLKSDDFFNAEEYPKLAFSSTAFEKKGSDTYRLIGDLTIRGNTKTVELEAVHGGTVQDPYGQTKAGFEITGTINRKEFGLEWDAVTEAGNIVVGEEIKLQLNVQIVEQEG